jgi:hypothetical protein
MPVQVRQRHAELAHRPVQPVQDHPQADRTRRPGRLAVLPVMSALSTLPGWRRWASGACTDPRGFPGLAREVELAGVDHPQPGHLPAGQAGERGQHPRGRGKRRTGLARRICRRGPQRLRQPVRHLPGHEPVRMAAHIHRPDQHRRQQGRIRLGGGAREDPHAPQARLPERVQLRQAAPGALGVEPRPLLVVTAEHVHLGAQAGDLGVEEAGRFGHHEPAERPADERGERRLEQGRPGRPRRGLRRRRIGQRRGLAAGAEHPGQAVPGLQPAGPGRNAPRPGRVEQRLASREPGAGRGVRR